MGQICMKTLLHEKLNMSKGLLLHKDPFEQRKIFAQRQFYTKGQFHTKIKKLK